MMAPTTVSSATGTGAGIRPATYSMNNCINNAAEQGNYLCFVDCFLVVGERPCFLCAAQCSDWSVINIIRFPACCRSSYLLLSTDVYVVID